MRRRVQNAFTLIEVCVSIAVIAVLTSVLLPTLASARETARRAMCRRQLHDVGVTLALYAANHDQFYPPFGSSATDRATNFLLNDLPLNEDWTGLWETRLLAGPEQLYCPSIRSDSYRFNTAANPFDGQAVRTSLSRRYLGRGDDPVATVDRVGGGDVVAADLIVSPAFIEYQHADGVNVLYGDGSVWWREEGAELFAESGFAGGPRAATNEQIDYGGAHLDKNQAP
jgi:prepilin-type N-terminal cleavage/methylation domain-containing protein/prepilin-type processing-associated H-X9-DG protein